jgi:hypothetical protein
MTRESAHAASLTAPPAHDQQDTTTLRPSAPPGHRLGRTVAAGLIVAASLTVVACGKTETKTATILNTEKVERAIEHSVSVQRGKAATVSCPSGVLQKKGLVFSCTALVKKASTQFVVTQQDGAGRVRYVAR